MSAEHRPPGADDVLDVCSRILHRESLRYERKQALTKREIDLIVRVARAAAEVVELQLDPLSAPAKRRLEALTDDELDAILSQDGKTNA